MTVLFNWGEKLLAGLSLVLKVLTLSNVARHKSVKPSTELLMSVILEMPGFMAVKMKKIYLQNLQSKYLDGELLGVKNTT